MPTDLEFWGTPDALSAEQVIRYLEHINLNAQATLARPPDYALLADVQLAQILHVPFDTSSMHLPLCLDKAATVPKPFTVMSGYGMAMSVQEAYVNVVERARGGYCFALNTLLAALLRALGFRVSTMAVRSYRRAHQDPTVAGYHWGPITHCCLAVDTIDKGRFISDVGFVGGASNIPVPFENGAKVVSISASETFELRHEPFPGVDPHHYPDVECSWTLYRHFSFPKEGKSHTTPVYSIVAQSISPADVEVLSYYAAYSSSLAAPFPRQLVVSRYNADGSRETLNWFVGEPCAKLYIREGVLGKVVQTEDIPLTNEALYDVCQRRFGFQAV